MKTASAISLEEWAGSNTFYRQDAISLQLDDSGLGHFSIPRIDLPRVSLKSMKRDETSPSFIVPRKPTKAYSIMESGSKSCVAFYGCTSKLCIGSGKWESGEWGCPTIARYSNLSQRLPRMFARIISSSACFLISKLHTAHFQELHNGFVELCFRESKPNADVYVVCMLVSGFMLYLSHSISR